MVVSLAETCTCLYLKNILYLAFGFYELRNDEACSHFSRYFLWKRLKMKIGLMGYVATLKEMGSTYA